MVTGRALYICAGFLPVTNSRYMLLEFTLSNVIEDMAQDKL